MDGSEESPLVLLHSDIHLVEGKLKQFQRLSTDEMIASLAPGQAGALKVRPDGTVLDGNHRIKVLSERGIDVDALPREVIPKV
jgi:archaellum component FlaG (FlaF/FlaG flagellin family)